MSMQTQSRFADLNIREWSGETPDEALACGANEYSVAEAKAIVQRFAEVTTSCDPDAFVQGFTEDSITSFNKRSGMTREELREFMASHFSRMGRPGAEYLCRKTLRTLCGNVFGVAWVDHWCDPDTGDAFRGKGLEFWIMRDGLIARWDASLFAWRI